MTAKPPPIPLNAIRAFVEAARSESFSRAARRLDITQGAVSRHVAALEKFLDARLFVRRGGAVTLSDVGRQYLESIDEAWSTIDLVTRQTAVGAKGRERLVVRTSLPTFALTALIPRLPGFQPESPMKVDLVTSLSEPDTDDVFDVLVTRDLRVAASERWEIARESLVCVASPARARECESLPAARWSFIASRSRPDVLPAWARQVKDAADIEPAMVYDHFFLATAAAIGGLGCLVVPRILVSPYLAEGVLVTLATPEVATGVRYWAFANPSSASPREAVAFCRWLKASLRDKAA